MHFFYCGRSYLMLPTKKHLDELTFWFKKEMNKALLHNNSFPCIHSRPNRLITFVSLNSSPGIHDITFLQVPDPKQGLLIEIPIRDTQVHTAAASYLKVQSCRLPRILELRCHCRCHHPDDYCYGSPSAPELAGCGQSLSNVPHSRRYPTPN